MDCLTLLYSLFIGLITVLGFCEITGPKIVTGIKKLVTNHIVAAPAKRNNESDKYVHSVYKSKKAMVSRTIAFLKNFFR